MKILILGAGGFIGSNLVEHLSRSGEHEIVGVDLDDEKLDPRGYENFRFHHVDFNADVAGKELEESDVVIDLVAFANPSLYVEKPLDIYKLNFVQNMNIVEACVEHKKPLIQYSTCEVYGRPSGDTYVEDESELITGPVSKQRWIYAAGKQLLERVIHAYGLEDELTWSIIRPFNFIGPRFDYLVPAGNTGGPRVFAQYMSALLTGGPMYLVDGGHQRRSFTHIDDASRGLEAILTNPLAHNQVFNVGNPENDISIRDMAIMMKQIHADLTGTESASELIDISGEEFYGEGYEDHTRVPADITKLRSLGWEPQHDLETTLRQTIEWYLEHHGDHGS